MGFVIQFRYQIMEPINANHQILNPNYVTGLADGEGSFSISLSPRPKMLVKWEVRPSFSLAQNKRSRGTLFKLKEFFGCGWVRESKGDNTWKYEVRSLEDLSKFIIPHFLSYPLKTAKISDFEKFMAVIEKMKNGQHLDPAGLKEIFSIAETMNPSGKRKYQDLMK